MQFLLVSPERAAPVERFLKRYGRELPVFLEYERIPLSFGLEAVPTTYIIDGDGTILLAHRGAADWDTAAARDFLLALSEP